MNFSEILVGARLLENGLLNLWHPPQLSATGCCSFQWQLKHDEWPLGDDLNVAAPGTKPSGQPLSGAWGALVRAEWHKEQL